jgi:hypothetical protein
MQNGKADGFALGFLEAKRSLLNPSHVEIDPRRCVHLDVDRSPPDAMPEPLLPPNPGLITFADGCGALRCKGIV